MNILKDPCFLVSIHDKDHSDLSSVPQENLPPPPSTEDIFGKVDALKIQFELENERIVKQLKENQVCKEVSNSLYLLMF